MSIWTTQCDAELGKIWEDLRILWVRPTQLHAHLLNALLSPIDIDLMPHQTPVHLLDLTSPPKSGSEPSVAGYFVHW